MTTLKIANWNIQWMNRWFTGDGNGPPAWKPSSDIAGVSDIGALTARVANVISTIDADILTVQEGPSRKTEMELFVSDRLNDAYEVIGPVGGGSQKSFTLVKTRFRSRLPRTVRSRQNLASMWMPLGPPTWMGIWSWITRNTTSPVNRRSPASRHRRGKPSDC